MTTNVTDRDRFAQVMRDLRKVFDIARMNVTSCCRSCISYEMAVDFKAKHGGREAKRVAWTAKVQGAINFDRDGRMVEVQYVNWSGDGVAETLVETFKTAGFEVEWNGTDHDTVHVSTKELDQS